MWHDVPQVVQRRHIEDGYHQSTEREARQHGLLLCQDDERPENSGIFFAEKIGGVPDDTPFDRDSAQLMLVDLLADLRARIHCAEEFARTIDEVWGLSLSGPPPSPGDTRGITRARPLRWRQCWHLRAHCRHPQLQRCETCMR